MTACGCGRTGQLKRWIFTVERVRAAVRWGARRPSGRDTRGCGSACTPKTVVLAARAVHARFGPRSPRRAKIHRRAGLRGATEFSRSLRRPSEYMPAVRTVVVDQAFVAFIGVGSRRLPVVLGLVDGVQSEENGVELVVDERR